MHLLDDSNIKLIKLFQLDNRNTIEQGYNGNLYEFYKAEHILIVSVDGVEVGHISHGVHAYSDVITFHDWEYQSEKLLERLGELNAYLFGYVEGVEK